MATHETTYIFVLSVLLMGGSLLILALPIFHHIMGGRGWSLVGFFGLPSVGFLLVGLALSALVVGDPNLLLPLVAAVATFRCLSPTLTFFKVREALEPKKAWYWIKALLVGVFIIMPGYLAFRLVFPADPTDAVILGERAVMAFGSTMVLIRFYMLLLPRLDQGRLHLLMAAILFSVALGIVAPYAFPAYAIVYALSGIAGWLLGLAFILRSI